MVLEVSWGRLARAVAFYRERGYTYVEVPWTTEKKYAWMTCDLLGHVERVAPGKPHDVLVGSSEVSFLQMRDKGQLPPGKYVGISPCFRNEIVDDLHQEYFMKVELYRDDAVGSIQLENMIDDAFQFFLREGRDQGLKTYECKWVPTQEGYDIMIGGVEVGSYGIRYLPRGRAWIYATGVAEPRFSRALALLKEGVDGIS